jgi:hypothetical protein
MAQFEELIDAISEMRKQVDELERINDLDTPERLSRSIIGHIAKYGEFVSKLAILIAVEAVQDGDISKRAAADKLRIHPHTLDRWIDRLDPLINSEMSTKDIIDNSA